MTWRRWRSRLWLVVDDVHELGPDALRQLELLFMRAPPGLRLVLAARHDVRLGLHRLRLDGGLAELRAADLKFTLAEAGELFSVAGVELDRPALAMLQERTEGWVAGLRLAALALAGGADPARFAAEFSAVSGRWRSICWLRCWTGRVSGCGGCCCGLPSWSGSAGSWPGC